MAFEDFDHSRGSPQVKTIWELHPAIVTIPEDNAGQTAHRNQTPRCRSRHRRMLRSETPMISVNICSAVRT